MGVLPGRQRGLKLRRSLPADLSRLRDELRVDCVVTLVPQSQLMEVGCGGLVAAVEAAGMRSWSRVAWRDKWVPSSWSLLPTLELGDALVGMVKGTEEVAESSRCILIHCFGGKGRTGVAAVALLLLLGKHSLSSAVKATRNARPGCIHNPLQLLHLIWLQNFLAANKARRRPSR